MPQTTWTPQTSQTARHLKCLGRLECANNLRLVSSSQTAICPLLPRFPREAHLMKYCRKPTNRWFLPSSWCLPVVSGKDDVPYGGGVGGSWAAGQQPQQVWGHE